METFCDLSFGNMNILTGRSPNNFSEVYTSILLSTLTVTVWSYNFFFSEMELNPVGFALEFCILCLLAFYVAQLHLLLLSFLRTDLT